MSQTRHSGSVRNLACSQYESIKDLALVDPDRYIMQCAGITVCAAWPVALVVRSPRLLAVVSQASVAICIAFAGVVLRLAFLPASRSGTYPARPYSGGHAAHVGMLSVHCSTQVPVLCSPVMVVMLYLWACFLCMASLHAAGHVRLACKNGVGRHW